MMTWVFNYKAKKGAKKSTSCKILRKSQVQLSSHAVVAHNIPRKSPKIDAGIARLGLGFSFVLTCENLQWLRPMFDVSLVRDSSFSSSINVSLNKARN